MDTLQHRIEAAKAQLQLQAPRIVLTMAQTGLALVTDRVQNLGLKGKRYSSNFIPTFLFKGKELNARGKAYIEKHPLGNWGGFRAAQGLPTGSVNLTYTGRMFRSLTVAPGPAAGTAVTARVTAADREAYDKVKHNEARYGPFLTPLPAEQAQVDQYASREISRVISQALRG